MRLTPPRLRSPLSTFWDQTTLELLNLYGSDRADMGGDSEMRGFYSSLLQRNAQLTDLYGGGSMTSLVLLDETNLQGGAVAATEPSEEEKGDHEYTLADFDGPFFSNKTRARLAVLASKGVGLTGAVVDKLGIPRPEADGRRAMLATMHVDQLISLVDGEATALQQHSTPGRLSPIFFAPKARGAQPARVLFHSSPSLVPLLLSGHITLSPELRAAGLMPPLDPANSLTRIGVGTASKRTISSTVHSAAIKKVRQTSSAPGAPSPSAECCR